MKLSVYFTPLGITPSAVAGKPVLVVDILRTTTTIIAAMANGARSIVPTQTAEDALKVARNLRRDDVLLAGERNAERIQGFELGNSPLEMAPDTVAGRTIVMATTNGTPAIVAAEGGAPVVVGAATNFTAAIERLRRELDARGELAILCAGRERMFSLEDAYAAGRFAQQLIPGSARRSADLNDGAIAALELVRRYGDRWKRAVSASAAGRHLRRLSFRDDVTAASDVDAHDVVPTYADRLVTVGKRGT